MTMSSSLSRLCRRLESIAWRDVGGRSSSALRIPGDLERAAVAFTNARSVLILTGFPCRVNAEVPSETDGLSGAIALAAAARMLGKPCGIATDDCCAEGLRRALATRENAHGTVIESFPGGVMPDTIRATSLVTRYDHTIAVERAGIAADGTYRTMRAINMGNLVAPLDVLLSAGTKASGGSGTRTSTGIGDGGNECGMGSVQKAVMKTVPNGQTIACVTCADTTILAGVSNWGAWALVAAVEAIMKNTTLLPTSNNEDELDRALETAGVGDGVTGQISPPGSVDGMQSPIHRGILNELREAVREWELSQAVPVVVPVLVIHGGAGTITRNRLSALQETAFRDSLTKVLINGRDSLRLGMSAIDVVTQVVTAMENDALFNAGIGSVLNSEGKHELDAAIMAGDGQIVGAVTCTTRIKNPIIAARTLAIESACTNSNNNGVSGPILLSGENADRWAVKNQQHIEMVDNNYFTTSHRSLQLVKAKKDKEVILDHDHDHDGGVLSPPIDETTKRGTVGAVCLDASGRLAAGTSTGGLTNKIPGRVGDTPVFGAGTWCDKRVALSGTGVGEAFLRNATCKDIASRVNYGGVSLKEAAQAGINDLKNVNGDGGVIAVDCEGNIAMIFNTEGMYRGMIRLEDELPYVAIYKDT